jgi:uncharacterized protein
MRRQTEHGLIFFLLSCTLLPCFAQQIPKPSGFVNDYAGIMKIEDIQVVENLAASVKKKTGAELTLVTVPSFAPYASIEEFSIILMDAWSIGERGKDNGVLLVLAMAERKVKIEVGYGLEGAIPDSTAGRILDTLVIPAFRRDDFSGGLTEGFRAIAVYIVNEKGLELSELNFPVAANTIKAPDFSKNIVLLFIIFFFIVFFIIALIMSRVSKKNGCVYQPANFNNKGSSIKSNNHDTRNSSGNNNISFSGGKSGGGGASRGF